MIFFLNQEWVIQSTQDSGRRQTKLKKHNTENKKMSNTEPPPKKNPKKTNKRQPVVNPGAREAIPISSLTVNSFTGLYCIYE